MDILQVVQVIFRNQFFTPPELVVFLWILMQDSEDMAAERVVDLMQAAAAAGIMEAVVETQPEAMAAAAAAAVPIAMALLQTPLPILLQILMQMAALPYHGNYPIKHLL
jgi:hypothetical protein